MKRFGTGVLAAVALTGIVAVATAAMAEPSGKAVKLPDGALTQEGAKAENGKWAIPDGSPSYYIKADRTVDWYTWSGFRRYHSECHVCHGPEGEGSTYAPALVESLKTLSYSDFVGIVASGKGENKGGTQFIMPALGDNKNVMCYIDDIYSYLKARSDGAQPRGRPAGREDAPQAFKDNEKSCIGG